jgi:NADPH:quinone reductase-like Zn-dependent oxidoreductase
MRAMILKGTRELTLDTVPQPHAGPGEVLIQLRTAALNHRDVWIHHGQYTGLKFPIILGSDGAGVVADVGPGVDTAWAGREVIINPAFHWGHDPKAPEPRFAILGLPKDGTFAEYIHVPVTQIAKKPTHLSWEEAAALPLAGLTAFRAVFSRAHLKAHEKILITGIGAGTALFALQFAAAAGAIPCVTSSSEDKLRRAHDLGSRAGALYTHSNWAKEFGEHHGPFDVIVDSAGGPGFADLLDLASAGGRIVFFGATQGQPPEFPTRKAFWKQLNLLGSTMGSPTDFQSMLAFVARHAIHPVIHEVVPLDKLGDAIASMDSGKQFGKIILKISEDKPDQD